LQRSIFYYKEKLTKSERRKKKRCKLKAIDTDFDTVVIKLMTLVRKLD